MYDGWKIIVGLIVCLAFFTFPFFYDAGKAAKAPELELTAKAKEAEACVAPKAYMTHYHMQLLDDWRHSVVRSGERWYDTRKGTWHLRVVRDLADATKDPGARLYQPGESKVYYKSLQVTCMDCHSNKTKFCDQCHNYMGVAPYCWDCHVEPEEKK